MNRTQDIQLNQSSKVETNTNTILKQILKNSQQKQIFLYSRKQQSYLYLLIQQSIFLDLFVSFKKIQKITRGHNTQNIKVGNITQYQKQKQLSSSQLMIRLVLTYSQSPTSMQVIVEVKNYIHVVFGQKKKEQYCQKHIKVIFIDSKQFKKHLYLQNQHSYQKKEERNYYINQ
ncbi:hypothetical protein ABPG72_016907 [Tetrahymena utriculariae]